MSAIYLNKVLIYLKQELPEEYQGSITLVGEKFVIKLSDTAIFQPAYELLHRTIEDSIRRIRKRDIDLNFSIVSKNQERDFKLLKEQETNN